jgi:hypothetical protein
MNAGREPLEVGWQPGAFATAALVAGAVLAAALAIHLAGLAAGLAVATTAALVPALAWHECWLDGPALRLRSLRTGLRLRGAHARAIARLDYRRDAGPPRLHLVHGREGLLLLARGRNPKAVAFRRAAMWLLVHGRRQARIDAALLDALAAMPDHAPTGLPHDTSHA